MSQRTQRDKRLFVSSAKAQQLSIRIDASANDNSQDGLAQEPGSSELVGDPELGAELVEAGGVVVVDSFEPLCSDGNQAAVHLELVGDREDLIEESEIPEVDVDLGELSVDDAEDDAKGLGINVGDDNLLDGCFALVAGDATGRRRVVSVVLFLQVARCAVEGARADAEAAGGSEGGLGRDLDDEIATVVEDVHHLDLVFVG